MDCKYSLRTVEYTSATMKKSQAMAAKTLTSYALNLEFGGCVPLSMKMAEKVTEVPKTEKRVTDIRDISKHMKPAGTESICVDFDLKLSQNYCERHLLTDMMCCECPIHILPADETGDKV